MKHHLGHLISLATDSLIQIPTAVVPTTHRHLNTSRCRSTHSSVTLAFDTIYTKRGSEESAAEGESIEEGLGVIVERGAES